MKFLFLTQIGKKITMAVAGLALIGFLIAHLTGNLLFFKSAALFNDYSHALISNPLIVVAEIGLLLFFLLHAIEGIWISLQNSAARPISYYKKIKSGSQSRQTLASKTMIWTGLLIFIFVPFHLWVFKYGPIYLSPGNESVRDLYRLVNEIFSNPFQVAGYTLIMIFIGFHLSHACGSALESLGVRYRPTIRRMGQGLAIIIGGGFALIPIFIFLSSR